MKQIVLLLLYFLGALVPLQAQLAKIDQRKLIDGGLDGKNYAMIVGNSSNLKAQISLQAMQESKSKTTELLKELGLLAETQKTTSYVNKFSVPFRIPLGFWKEGACVLPPCLFTAYLRLEFFDNDNVKVVVDNMEAFSFLENSSASSYELEKFRMISKHIGTSKQKVLVKREGWRKEYLFVPNTLREEAAQVLLCRSIIRANGGQWCDWKNYLSQTALPRIKCFDASETSKLAFITEKRWKESVRATLSKLFVILAERLNRPIIAVAEDGEKTWKLNGSLLPTNPKLYKKAKKQEWIFMFHNNKV